MTTRLFVLFVVLIAFATTLHAQVYQWAKQSNGNMDQLTIASVTDGQGNTFLTGTFDGVVLTFGSTTLTNPAMLPGNPSAFLVKYDATGNVLWAKLVGGGEYDAANSITMDRAGNLYVYGNFYNPTISFGAITLTNASHYDNFLVKLDTAGNPIWATVEHESATASGADYAIGVAADDSGHVIVTGSYDSSIVIGGTHLASPGGAGGMYLAKYDTSGHLLWATTNSGGGSSLANAITLDGNGNIYIAGYSLSSSLSFDDSTITNIGGTDLFLAKYSPGGAVRWVRDIVDSCNSGIDDIDADDSGNLYVAGGFNCPSIILGAYTLTNAAYAAGSANSFVAQYSPTGTVNWAKKGGGTLGDAILTLDVTPQNFVVLGGESSSLPSVFGPDTLRHSGIFLAEYSSTGTVRWLNSASVPSHGGIFALSHDAAGNLYSSGYFSDSLQADGNLIIDTSTVGNPEIFTTRISNPTTAVPEVKAPLQLLVYPNPATTQLNITSGTRCISQVIITDLSGHDVSYTTLIANTAQLHIDISSLSAGVYLVRINGTEARKFVKE